MTSHILARTLVAVWLIAAVAQTPQAVPSGIIAGRIVDASGAAVPAAKVVLLRGPAPEGPVRGYPEGTDHVLSDDSGRFVFTGVAAGTYRIEADKPGWLTGALGRRRPGGPGSTLDLAEGDRRNDFVISLWRAAVIGGQVLDDAGDPLIGAEVRVVKQVFIAGRRQADTPLRARTDDRGIYRFSGLLPGEYVVVVLQSVLSEPEGFAGAILAKEMPASYYQTMTSTGAMPVVFDRAAGATGPGRPLIGSLSPLAALPTASAAWPVYLTTYHPASTSLSEATPIRVQAGEVRADVDVTVRLAPTWTVSGVVRDAAGAAAWHAVHLVPAETVDRPIVDVATAVTDSKGAFTLYGVPPGRYSARVIRIPAPSGATFGLASGGTGEIPQVMAFFEGPPGAAPPSSESLWYATDVVVVGDRPVRDVLLTMREGPRVRGRVRFEGNRAQPTIDEWQAANVTLLPANGRVDGMEWQAPISNDSRFASASVWPGKYLITATPPAGWQFKDATYQGRDVSSRPIDISADLDNLVMTFTDQTHTIKGNVQVEPGSSAEQATVLMFPVESALWVDFGRSSRTLISTRVAASGQFTLRLPPAGDYFMVAIPDESAEQWQNPAVLAKLAPQGVRVHVTGDTSLNQSLQLSRIR